jgi:MscS family membrane protein
MILSLIDSVAEGLPDWFSNLVPDGVSGFFTKSFYHNTVWDWTVTLLIILGSVIIARVIYWIAQKFLKRVTKKTKTKLDDILVDKVEEPVVLGIVVIGLWIGFDRLTFPEGTTDFFGHVFQILIAIDITWFLARTVDALIIEYLVPIVNKSDTDLDDQLMPILRKGIRSAIWILGIIVGLNNAGYNVGALLAGVGIGGIALAMAAKDFVANIFGGVTVFVDKPFTISDRIQIDGYDGSVEEIGIRSTRIKTLAGRIVTIPNHKFTDGYVENVSIEPSRKMSLDLGLIYDTTPEQMEKAIELLNNVIDETMEIEDDRIIGFSSFGDFSLGIKFIYYIKKESDLMETISKVNFSILKKFNAEGLEFAFPTQTIITESGSSES